MAKSVTGILISWSGDSTYGWGVTMTVENASILAKGRLSLPPDRAHVDYKQLATTQPGLMTPWPGDVTLVELERHHNHITIVPLPLRLPTRSPVIACIPLHNSSGPGRTVARTWDIGTPEQLEEGAGSLLIPAFHPADPPFDALVKFHSVLRAALRRLAKAGSWQVHSKASKHIQASI